MFLLRDLKNLSLMTKKDQQLLKCFRDTPSMIVFWSFRYFLGRMTIATCMFAEDLAKAWPYLEPNTQSLIMRELEEEFKRDDDARAENKNYKPLGHDCDRAAWQKVRNVYWQQLPYDAYYRKQLREGALKIINNGHDSRGDDDEGYSGNSHS